jgi:drug/metabolite transporter (DMT)-like permease
MAHFTLEDEQLTVRKSIGVALALSGALLLAILGESGLPDVQRASPLGYGLVIGAMVFASAGTIYARKYLQPYDAFDVASVRMFAAALAIMPLSLLFVGFNLGMVNTNGFLALGWASVVGTFAGQLLAFYIIQRFGATPSALTAYVIPIIASIGGALVLGESITPGMLAAMALIILGISLLNERRRIEPLPITQL